MDSVCACYVYALGYVDPLADTNPFAFAHSFVNTESDKHPFIDRESDRYSFSVTNGIP
jgi:hypothetical protein